MRMHHLLGATALASSLLIGTPTFAQESQSSNPAQVDEPAVRDGAAVSNEEGQTSQNGDDADVVVTGSRIRRPNLESGLPITAIGGEEIFQRAQNNLGDALNELPQLRSTVAQQNPGLGIGIQGLNLLDLRGLGTQRTLTLVNGRRHVPADILNNAVSVDVNSIPNDLVERIEVVTGANSAVYGSDAIAGVVNFILKRNFDGVQLRGGAGVSEQGFGGNQIVSLLAGKNFGGGRANLTFSAEYAHQSRIYGSDIDFLRRVDGFVVTDTDPAGLTNGSDGVPDRTFVRDIRSGSINRYGMVPITQPTTNPLCGTGIINPTAGTPFNCNYVFGADGRLSPQTGSRVSTGPIGSFIGGNGQTGREDTQLSVLPYQKRANFNLLGHYEFSQAADLFFEAKYVRIESSGSNSGPAFTQGATFGDARERPRLDNPYLNPADRTTIANAILASGFRPILSSRTALNDADRTAIADGSFRFADLRNLLDLGLRDEYAKRDTYRFVAGLRGTFNDDWSYEISGNYGRVSEKTTVLGNLVSQRFLLAMDSGRNPVTGQIQCRSQFDPSAAVSYDDSTGDGAALAADIAACVPYNPFGAANNAAARNYIVQDTQSTGRLEQYVASGFVSGDLSQLFELPGGPVGFSVGAEYRREDAKFEADPLVAAGRTFLNALQTFDPPYFEVKEAFGELSIPLLKNLPFIEELTFNGAGRVSDYRGAAGTVYTYNAGVTYAPVRDIRFRANYGRAVRAPNYTETGSPLGQNFAPGFQDPCSGSRLSQGSANRAANCAADLGALLNDPNFVALPTYSLELLSGSNPDLTSEKSNTLTFGAVFQPSFLPGLSLTSDYFDTKVKNVIVAPSAQQIANSCYDLPDLNNQFCALLTRFRGTGDARGPNDEVPGEILAGSLTAIPLNFASRRRRGIDTELVYRTTFGSDAKFFGRVLYTHNIINSNFEDPTRPNFENRLLSELGNPKDEFLINADVTFGPVTVGYRGRYISPMVVNTYEDQNSLQGRAPENADYADILKYPSVVYHNLRLDVQAGEDEHGLLFTFGVDNLANKKPPLGSSATGAGSSIYDIRGRAFYTSVRARF
jgi:outer membrane receptor protein involved in Fe transport